MCAFMKILPVIYLNLVNTPGKKVCYGCSVLVENVCYDFWDKSWGFVTDVSFLVITCWAVSLEIWVT